MILHDNIISDLTFVDVLPHLLRVIGRFDCDYATTNVVHEQPVDFCSGSLEDHEFVG